MKLPFKAAPLSEQYARQICTWRYPAPYDIFNWPEWDTMVQDAYEFGDSDIRDTQYAAILDDTNTLIGYAQFFPLLGVTRLGFSMKPELCGLGHGPDFVRFIAEEARRRMPQDAIDLEVLTWNTRAIKAYEKAGFSVTDTYEKMTPSGVKAFHCMVLSFS